MFIYSLSHNLRLARWHLLASCLGSMKLSLDGALIAQWGCDNNLPWLTWLTWWYIVNQRNFFGFNTWSSKDGELEASSLLAEHHCFDTWRLQPLILGINMQSTFRSLCAATSSCYQVTLCSHWQQILQFLAWGNWLEAYFMIYFMLKESKACSKAFEFKVQSLSLQQLLTLLTIKIWALRYYGTYCTCHRYFFEFE